MEKLFGELKRFRIKYRKLDGGNNEGERNQFKETNQLHEKKLARKIKHEFDKLRTYKEKLNFWLNAGFNPYDRIIRLTTVCVTSIQIVNQSSSRAYNPKTDISIVPNNFDESETYIDFCLEFENLLPIEQKLRERKQKILQEYIGKDDNSIRFILKKELEKMESKLADVENVIPDFNLETRIGKGNIRPIGEKKYLLQYISFLNGEIMKFLPKASTGIKQKINEKKLIWRGTQKQLGELIVELEDKRWIEPIQHGDRESIIRNLCSLFDLSSTKKKADSNEVTSLIEILRPDTNPNTKEKSYPGIYATRYRPSFKDIKRNSK